MNTNPDNQHLILELKEKSVQTFLEYFMYEQDNYWNAEYVYCYTSLLN